MKQWSRNQILIVGFLAIAVVSCGGLGIFLVSSAYLNLPRDVSLQPQAPALVEDSQEFDKDKPLHTQDVSMSPEATPEGGVPSDQVLVVIAAHDIRRGTNIPEDGVIFTLMPANMVMETMISGLDESDLRSRVIGRVASQDIERGLPITVVMLEDEPSPQDVYVEIVTCEDINDARETMTDIEWQEYQDKLPGKWLQFTGTVYDIFDDTTVNVDGCLGWDAFAQIYDTPIEQATLLKQDDPISGTYEIMNSSTMLFKVLTVNWSE